MQQAGRQAEELVARYGTRDPYLLCEHLGIEVLPIPLSPHIRGFFCIVLDYPFIYINQALSEEEARVTLAHELGHVLLHPQLNALFLASATFTATSRLERQADGFAAQLLLEDKWFSADSPYDTLEKISIAAGVPLHYVQLKREQMEMQE